MSNFAWRTCPACQRPDFVEVDEEQEGDMHFCRVCLNPRSMRNVMRSADSRRETSR